MLEARSLTKTYKNAIVPAVNAVDMRINTGEKFGILGPNGAGKTTLISMFCDLIRPSSGQLIIAGKDLSRNKAEIKKQLGVVPQDIALYPDLSARENLLFFGALYGLRRRLLRDRVDEELGRLGLSSFASEAVRKFSGGMKRRVNLAAALLHKPNLLIMDEPTVGIDVQSKGVIMNYLGDLNDKGMTMIYTSHHLHEAQKFCSRIAVLDHGKIVAEDTPDALIATSKGADLEDTFLTITGESLRDDV